MFRFTIRDVLWLMVVVGLTVAWLGERRTGTMIANRYDRLKRMVIDGDVHGREIDFGDDGEPYFSVRN